MNILVQQISQEYIFAPLFADGGILREGDGSIKLWYSHFKKDI